MSVARVVVFGGSGFLGSHICRAAVRKEFLVTSISRSGGTSTYDGISYEKADIFSPEKYREYLKDAKAVIYSAGMFLEGDYKSLAQGKWDPSKVIGLLSQNRNPLQADPTQPRGYDKLNRDGGLSWHVKLIIAILVAKEAASAGVPTFTFISAAGNFPGVPSRYVTSKREAESAIAQIDGLRSVFIRPGLMYSNHDRPHLAPLKGVIAGIARINKAVGGNLPLVGAAGVAPLDVDLVARATIAATLDESVNGIVGVDALSRLGT